MTRFWYMYIAYGNELCCHACTYYYIWGWNDERKIDVASACCQVDTCLFPNIVQSCCQKKWKWKFEKILHCKSRVSKV